MIGERYFLLEYGMPWTRWGIGASVRYVCLLKCNYLLFQRSSDKVCPGFKVSVPFSSTSLKRFSIMECPQRQKRDARRDNKISIQTWQIRDLRPYPLDNANISSTMELSIRICSFCANSSKRYCTCCSVKYGLLSNSATLKGDKRQLDGVKQRMLIVPIATIVKIA